MIGTPSSAKLLSEPSERSIRFKLKIRAPRSSWQGHLALYRLAHRFDLKHLCQTTLAIQRKETDQALRGSDATQFVKAVLKLSQDETRSLKEEMAREIAAQRHGALPRHSLDSLVLAHPQFGCDLMKAMRSKEREHLEQIDVFRRDVFEVAKAMVDATNEIRQLEKQVRDQGKKQADGDCSRADSLVVDNPLGQ